MKNKKTLLLALPVLLLPLFFAYQRSITSSVDASSIATESNLPTYTASELAQYDGSDPNKPIYIGYNGYVYDVTAGKQYYEAGGVYNFLAGKDSSDQLNIIGGDIIQKKYPIVGKLVD